MREINDAKIKIGTLGSFTVKNLYNIKRVHATFICNQVK